MKYKFIFSLCAALLALSTSAQAKTIKKYRITISFNSFASGTPDAGPLETFIKKFKKANKIKSICADHIGPLGREGEYKLGFKLKELTAKQQQAFIKQLQPVLEAMNEKGSATLEENDTIDMATLPAGVTAKLQKY